MTGDDLMVTAWASGRLAIARVPMPGRLFGSAISQAPFSLTTLRLAEPKAALPFDRTIVLGVPSNTSVCLALWRSLPSRQPVHRVILTVRCCLCDCGFVHAVPNMYFNGFGLMVKDAAGVAFWNMMGATGTMYPNRILRGFAVNLTVVTIGNVVGGAVLVADSYWLLYRRPKTASN